MPDLQNNIKSSQVCGPQPCELCFFIRILQIRNIMDNWQANPAPCKVTWIGAYLSIPDCALQTPSDS